jgi:LysM repeat protein
MLHSVFRIFSLSLTVLLSISLASASLPEDTDDPVQYHRQMLTNLRAERGLTELRWDDRLAAAALEQAEWMVRSRSYAHFHNGSRPSTRARSAGYIPDGWCCGENTFVDGGANMYHAWNFWMNSPPHYRSLTTPDYVDYGIATASLGNWHGFVIVLGKGSVDDTATSESNTSSTVASTPVPPDNGSAESSRTEAFSGSCDLIHTVRPGENLFRIGLRYQSSMQQIAVRNNISNLRQIYPGQSLCIPDGQFNPLIAQRTESTPALETEINDDNWCYPGNPWGDGRCNNPDDPYQQQYMWECGWFKAQNIEHPECEN